MFEQIWNAILSALGMSTEEVTNNTISSDEERAAYKMDFGQMNLIKTRLNQNELEAAIISKNGEGAEPVNTVDAELIAFQFIFRNIAEDYFIEIAQVYFLPEMNQYFSTAIKNSDKVDIATHNILEVAHLIIEEETINKDSTFYETSSDQNKMNYRNLDFYVDDIGFIFFTIDQIENICFNATNFTISGSQIIFGKKLTHPDEDHLYNYEGSYFTLKIESNVNLFSVGTLSGSAEISDSVLGHPCPPIWYNLRQAEKIAFRIQGFKYYSDNRSASDASEPNGPDKLKALRQSWMKEIHTGDSIPSWFTELFG